MITGRRGPSRRVLAAFGARTPAVAVPGGQGVTWRAGELILKPTDDPALAAWCAETLTALVEDGRFRVSRPVAQSDGWVADGWTAWRWVEGAAADWRIHEIAAAGAAFHEALRAVPRPDLLDRCEDPWRYADRIAWGEEAPATDGPYADLLHRLAAVRTPLTAPCQLIHPDLAGNVLFAAGLPPAVIDWPPYWRPETWAPAVVAVDGLDTGRVSAGDALALGTADDWLQLLIRAEMFRVATKNTAALRGINLVDDKVHHRSTVRLLCRLATEPRSTDDRG
ncbi:TIGR02569 family protein [Paractinoplanes rishiriensis]|uniref:TIGR02569 family protein n=1 Tax=Paractinoplanes rishiriensis TaxID=1050105 RepID=A0A919JXA1_9ACTN|nr:TIGR02569 family protein [Actinoplanes rishiriensis]GIE95215.1 TIGR02569 family protein [Actinoplanes rishiriensis]